MGDTARRILIVEDEALVALVVEDALRQWGYAIFGIAANVKAARALLAHGVPDAAVLDINLDGERSYPVAALLRERRVPFVFITGYDDCGEAEWAAVPCVNKPIDWPELEQKLKVALGEEGSAP